MRVDAKLLAGIFQYLRNIFFFFLLETDAPNPSRIEESIHTLERTKVELLKQRELLEQKLQKGSLLDPKEERR